MNSKLRSIISILISTMHCIANCDLVVADPGLEPDSPLVMVRVGMAGSQHGNIVIEGDNAIAGIDLFYELCPTGGGSKRLDEPKKLYFWKEGESPILVSDSFDSYASYSLERELTLEDSGKYYWMIGDGEKTYSFNLEVQPQIYTRIRQTRWTTGGCFSEDNPYWFYSEVVGWNFSKYRMWPWVYHYKKGWMYLILMSHAAWVWHNDERRFYYLDEELPWVGVSTNGDLIDLR